MRKWRIKTRDGYTLIEIIVVMIIISIIAGVVMQSLDGAIDISRFEETREEMDKLAVAIAGDPALKSSGVRTDYGYIGDIGALPTGWDDLVTDPGLGNWQGPYVHDEFSAAGANIEFKIDAWGNIYSSPSAASFSSTGGPETMTRSLANSQDDLLYNSASFSVVDLDYTPPGNDFKDSVLLVLTYPNGIGSYNTTSQNPDAGGFAQFDSIPIGIHSMQMIYLPVNDTLPRKINVDPGQDYYADIQYYADVWGGASGAADSLEYIEGSDSLLTGNCGKLLFWIINNTGSPVTVSTIRISWTGPTAYFKLIYWDGVQVHSSPVLTSGSLATLDFPQTINDGESMQLRLEHFKSKSNGTGSPVDMSGADFTLEFSDGTVLTFTADQCGH